MLAKRGGSSGSLQHTGSPSEHWHASQVLSGSPSAREVEELHAVVQHVLQEQAAGLCSSLLHDWDRQWFGGAASSDSAASTSEAPSICAHGQRSAVVETPEAPAAWLADSSMDRRFPQLSHCGSLYLGAGSSPPCYLSEEAAAELGIGAWQQQQEQQQQQQEDTALQQHHYRHEQLPTSRLGPHAGGTGTVPYLRNHLHRHSPATMSPQERTPEREGGGSSSDAGVPHATSISVPYDLPTVLASSSPGHHHQGDNDHDSLPGSSTSPTLTVLNALPDHHHPALPALPLLPPAAPLLLLPAPPVPMLPPSSHSSGQESNNGSTAARQPSTGPVPLAAGSRPEALAVPPPLLGTWVHRQYRMLTDTTHLGLMGGGRGRSGGDPLEGGHAHSQPDSIANSVPMVPGTPSQQQAQAGGAGASLARMRTVHSDTQLGSSADMHASSSVATTATATTQQQRAAEALPPPPTTLGLPQGHQFGAADQVHTHDAQLQQHTQQQQQQQGNGYGTGLHHPQAAQALQQEQQVVAPQRVNGASDSGSDAVVEAAWRWRFARRWHAEQQRSAQPPEGGEAGSPDKTEEALAFLRAGGGGGWNMQVARTQSTEQSGLMHSVGTQGLGSLLAGDMLLEECNSSFTGGGATGGNGGGAADALSRAARCSKTSAAGNGNGATNGTAQHHGQNGAARPQHFPHRSAGMVGGGREESATRAVNSLNRRALQLLEQQHQLQRAAEELWNTSVCAGDNWVGQHLPAVEIDEWGTFKFLVVRLRGRNGKQRILVRGRNYCSEGQLIEDVTRKMAQVASHHGCAAEAIEVMGGGVMEWRRERDRHLHLHSGFSAVPSSGMAGKQPASCQELLNLAAVLAKQLLPVNFKVSIQGAIL